MRWEEHKSERVYEKKADEDFEAHLIAFSCGEPPERALSLVAASARGQGC